ncbi:protein VASCULAR ASSOCIATED DEATH 1, chloroplastic [Lactuca sativa]|uniref:protein VASCULAR ASSOCIATED DEATH 1, chloroplastic n=1 Tax=Lactuca sativa TaxID=4236 RepID=UPI000CD9D8AE|nr:protein VASCULAR ASSOCIATED DEATH 1, chloroplastic [Lactuca sativa]
MAVATTSSSDNIAPPSQSMDKSPTTNLTDAAAVTESLSAVNGSSSASPADLADNSKSSYSPSRQLEFQPSLRSEEYRQLFRLPPEEVLIQDFNCALQENFILQGHMYLFFHHICFYSNLFGFETKKIIHFDEITEVKRAKTAGIFPTAIELTASEKKYFFTSFLSRDEAFKLINDGWLEHGSGSKAISDQQVSRSGLIDEEPEIVMVEDSDEARPLGDDLEITNGSSTGDNTPEDPNRTPGSEADVSLRSSRVQDAVDDDTIVVQNTDCSSSGKSLAWEVGDSDAPIVPEGYTLAAESTFPIKVDEFFSLFFSDEALPFLESYHNKCGDKDLKCTSWKPHDQLGYAREVSFQHPIKIYFGARFGSCNEVQNFRVYKNSHLVVKTSQVINDVPYGDYFCVEGLWEVVADSNNGCRLRVYVNVAFSKKTMWKGKIVQATIEECRDTFAAWIELAHVLLKQKNIEKEANLIAAVNVEETRVPEHSEAPGQQGDITMMTQTVPVSQEVKRQVSSSGSSGTASNLRDSIPKLFASFKSQNHVPSFVVILMAVVILLMQISIVVLLLRPQTVQVVSDTSWMSNSNTRIDRRGETVNLLNKQIDHLKEEMLIVETLLQKMRHEHDMLNVQLKKLMLHKN